MQLDQSLLILGNYSLQHWQCFYSLVDNIFTICAIKVRYKQDL